MVMKSLKYFTHTVIITYNVPLICCLITVLTCIVVLLLTLDTDVLYRDFDMLIT